MRIVSLLPSATEIVYALGCGDALVGVTHECDYPPAAQTRPAVTQSMLDHTTATSADIDAAVRNQLHTGVGIYALDVARLAELAPDLIITQELCEVCAVSFGTVTRAVRDISTTYPALAPQIISLEPTSLADILATIMAVGERLGCESQASAVIADAHARVRRVQQQVAGAAQPRVACLEWVDPLFGPGHWLPELVELAGGVPVIGQAGANSQRVVWDDVRRAAPDVIVVTPCGFGLERAQQEACAALPHLPGWEDIPAVQTGRVAVVDGNSYFSRPGPRIIESLELLAAILHPDRCAGWGPAGSWEPMRLARAV